MQQREIYCLNERAYHGLPRDLPRRAGAQQEHQLRSVGKKEKTRRHLVNDACGGLWTRVDKVYMSPAHLDTERKTH